MYSKETQNYALPQFQATDKMDPVADFNAAFETIDSELHKNSLNQVKEFTDEAIKQIEAMRTLVERAENAAEGAVTAIQGLTAVVTNLNAKVDAIDARVKALENRFPV